MSIRKVALGLALAAAALAACGRQEPAAPAGEPPAASPAPVTPPDATAPAAAPVAMPRVAAPAGSSVAILSPKNGETVTSPLKVVFGASNVAIVPAGDSTPDSGHHHLLVDVPLPADMGQPIPKDEQHLHFGKGQTDAEITLAPGTHSLQLLLGDANHVPHDPPVYSEQVTINVR